MGNLAATNFWNYKYDIVSIQDAINEYLEQDCKTTSNLCRTERRPRVKRAIFNPPATVILWDDGTKSVVKCQNGEPFDAEKGFVMAYLKKLLGNDNTFNKEIARWVKYDAPVAPVESTTDGVVSNERSNVKFNTGDRARIVRNLHGHFFKLGTIVKLKKYKYDYCATNNRGEYWWVTDDELEPVETKEN